MPVDSDVDRRDFYRLVTDSRPPLDFCLTMQDERVFCTNIDDLSASGFGCRIIGLARLQNKQAITALFVLPMEKPCIIKSEVFLVSVLKGDDEGDNFRFLFTDEIKESDRDFIHSYIVLKKVKALERTRQKNVKKYYDDYLEPLTGD
jgi:hypothetical protein